MESGPMTAAAGSLETSCDPPNNATNCVGEAEDGWITSFSRSKYKGRKSKDKHGSASQVICGDTVSVDNKNLPQYINRGSDAGCNNTTRYKYKGSKSRDNKYGRRSKSGMNEERTTTALLTPSTEDSDSSLKSDITTPQPCEVTSKEESPEPTTKLVEQVPDTPTQSPPRETASRTPVPREESKHSPALPLVQEQQQELNNHDENHQVEEEEEDKSETPKYVYKDDQWSPLNQSGKRQYDRNFLLELQNNPLSLKRPESLPNLEVVLDNLAPVGISKNVDSRSFMGSMIMGGPADLLSPSYVKGTRINKKMINNRPSYNSNKNIPKIVPALRLGSSEFKKLKTTENPWTPKNKDTTEFGDDDEKETDDVLKRMRGILNKLTPDNFKKLLNNVKSLPLSNSEPRLIGVINLIFEKAVDEQSFSTTYAQLCEALSQSVRTNNAKNDQKAEKNFRFLIISRCQKEFEKDTMEELKEKWQKHIDEVEDSGKKDELRIYYECKEMIMRKRSVGNIRFIGELYKLKMLTSVIMMRIIETLIKKADSESLECLCKLLATIGNILEGQALHQPKAMEELNHHFGEMQRLVNDKKTNSRVRFLMMDAIDLRKNNWVARREESKPKTKAQVHEEVKREEEQQQIALNNAPRRDDRGKRNSRDNRGSMMDDGWNVVPTSRGRTFDPTRLKNSTFGSRAAPEKDVQLRGTGFGLWGRGSSGGVGAAPQDDSSNGGNRFNVLGEGVHGDERKMNPMCPPRFAPSLNMRPGGSFGSKSMPPPSEKEMVISMVKQLGGPDRSRSAQRSRDPSPNKEAISVSVCALKGQSSLSDEVAEKYTHSIIEEFTSIVDFKEAKQCLIEKFSAKTIPMFVQFALEWVVDRDDKKRKLVGQLFNDLLINNILGNQSFIGGVRESLSMIEDYCIDIPQICSYYGEIFAPVLAGENSISLQNLCTMATYANEKKAKLLASILHKALDLMAPDKLKELWTSSGIKWTDILQPGANVSDFLSTHNIDFLGEHSVAVKKSKTENIAQDLYMVFKSAEENEIMNWIEANVSTDDSKTKKFVRTLVTALVESQTLTSSDGSSIIVPEDFQELLKKKLPVVLKYVYGSDTLETEVIYSLQALSVKHSHPAGLLEQLFYAFYDLDIISEEAFIDWEKKENPEEQEGKGVCVKSVQNFLQWIQTDDDGPT